MYTCTHGHIDTDIQKRGIVLQCYLPFLSNNHKVVVAISGEREGVFVVRWWAVSKKKERKRGCTFNLTWTLGGEQKTKTKRKEKKVRRGCMDTNYMQVLLRINAYSMHI
jgi:hypothetical protein